MRHVFRRKDIEFSVEDLKQDMRLVYAVVHEYANPKEIVPFVHIDGKENPVLYFPDIVSLNKLVNCNYREFMRDNCEIVKDIFKTIQVHGK